MNFIVISKNSQKRYAILKVETGPEPRVREEKKSKTIRTLRKISIQMSFVPAL
jgi:hypothetical protein